MFILCVLTTQNDSYFQFSIIKCVCVGGESPEKTHKYSMTDLTSTSVLIIFYIQELIKEIRKCLN